jgi:hypothetical protein
MNHELLVSLPTTEPAARQSEATTALPVTEVLAQIGRDSRREPQQYLEESVTPHGGE